jgi:hypothetical protein
MNRWLTMVAIVAAVFFTAATATLSVASVVLLVNQGSKNQTAIRKTDISFGILCDLIRNLSIQARLAVTNPPLGDTPAKRTARFATYQFEQRVLSSTSCKF